MRQLSQVTKRLDAIECHLKIDQSQIAISKAQMEEEECPSTNRKKEDGDKEEEK